MDDETRVDLLERVNRQSATVGAKTPETITIGGETVDLQEFIIETRELPEIPPGTKELVSTAKQRLRNERTERVDRLKNDESLDHETAKELADEIVGIDRARNALDSLYRPDYAKDVRTAEIDDYKRWLGFLESVQ